MRRMVRVGKWKSEPSPDAKAAITAFLKGEFDTDKVWMRKEHGAVVVAVQESADNTEAIEKFRFNRKMNQRYQFSENDKGEIEVELVRL